MYSLVNNIAHVFHDIFVMLISVLQMSYIFVAAT